MTPSICSPLVSAAVCRVEVGVDNARSPASECVVRAVLDTGHYPTDISYSDKDIAALSLVRHDFHDDWNYTLLPGNTP